MKKLTLLFLLIAMGMNAQEKAEVINIEPIPNQEIRQTANLSQGVQIEDLSWAWNSQNACFTALQQRKFSGNHVFFTGIIPPYSEISVTVIPKDKNANFSIYAYQVGVDKMPIVPDLHSCIRCEADYKWDRKWKGRTQDHTRSIDNLVALSKPYRMVIAVVGAEGLKEGEFTLVVSTKSR